jgi:hypothetical protein
MNILQRLFLALLQMSLAGALYFSLEAKPNVFFMGCCLVIVLISFVGFVATPERE